MDSLTLPRTSFKENSFEIPQPPQFLIMIETVSPFEQSIWLSATSTPLPLSPLKPMDAYELFHLAESSDDISKIMDLLEPDKLLKCMWSYFQHCQQTAQKLEKEAQFQKGLANSLLGELQQLYVNEVLCPVIVKARRQDQQIMCFAWLVSNITIRPPNSIPPPTDSTTLYPTEMDYGGPSHPIIIVHNETTSTSLSPAPSSPTSSASSLRKRKGPAIPRWTSRYVQCMWTGLLNLGSLV